MKNFDKSIRSCFDTLESMELLAQAGPGCSLRASDSFKKASLRARSYREVYDSGVTNQDFNIMLSDHSFFQFTLQENGDIRLAFYPNPYKFVEFSDYKRDALSLLDNQELTHEEYSQLLSEAEFSGDVPAIRYDYSLEQYCENYHPAAHFHIGFFADNRWPTKRILTPYAFMLKILRHYYLKYWIKILDTSETPSQDKLDEIYRNEVSNCPLLDDNNFSQKEEERLHFL